MASEKKQKSSEAPDLFRYGDYRAFLADYFSHRKAADRAFSLRVFARLPELKLSSSSFISAVIKGRKNLSQPLRLRFARAMRLGPAEVEYFDALVRANQSRSAEERAHFLSQLARRQAPRARLLAEEALRLHARWHHGVVWHYFALHQDRNNPALIARDIKPALTAREVEESIRLLLEMRLIKRLANGYAVTDRHLATGKGFRGEAAKAHNRELLRLAAEGLESDPPEARQYNAMTFSVSRRGVERMRERIDAFRAELREMVERDEGADSVYAFTVQLFPCVRREAGSAGRGTTSDTGNPEAT